MNHLRVYLLLLLPALAAAANGIEGDWNGTLDVGAMQLRLVLHLTRSADGVLGGTLDSVDQSALGIPLSKVSQQDRSLKIEIQAAGATYEGQWSADGAEISGTFHQRGQNLPLKFRRGPAPEVARPQVPKRPYPYDEEEVAFDNAKAGVRLAGTLTLPRTAGPHPAVLLITGSGPQDRDEAIMGHRPFLVIADHLTRQGIAVLRVDDRGVGKSTGKFSEGTTTDFAGDARAGVDFLKARKDIDAKKIGLIGHSEGAVIAPMLASQSSDIAFVVMLAGPGVNGEEIIVAQQSLINKAGGMPEDMARRYSETERAVLDIAKHETDDAIAQRKMREAVEKLSADLPEGQREAHKALVAQLESQMKALKSAWFHEFLNYDPRPTLENVKAPVLAMWGELDLQVPPKQNLPAVAAALEAGGNRDHTLVKLAHLNHLFQTAQTGAPMEYAKIEETFAPAALEVMAHWIRRHTE